MATLSRPANLLRFLAALLVLSALLLVVGVSLERAGVGAEAHTEGETVIATETAGTHTESEGGETGGEATAVATAAVTHAETSGEALLGLNLENPWLIGAFAVISLVLAAAVLLLGRPALLLAILMAGAATLFDLWEILNQARRDNLLLAGLAVIVALAHAAAVIIGLRAWPAQSVPSPLKRMGP